jgi:hypothetical protein
MIRWACTVRQPDGTWLLAENPLRGLSLPKETSPKRPVATHDRFLAVLGAIHTLAAEAKTKRARAQCVSSSRWSWSRQRDVELARCAASLAGRRDRPASDHVAEGVHKQRREQTIPIPEHLANDIRALRAKLRAFGGGGLFPQTTGDQPWHRKRFDALMRRAETKAELPKLAVGSGTATGGSGRRIGKTQ